ncbi:MAG TPA: UPF0175 family protein [Saprospiraceae bacterium]|nr:UPF0175 family protein [Saprospiraceae bacterium]
MNVIEIKLPDSLELSSFEVKMSLASKLFEQGKLTSGQGAELVGLSKRSFIEMLGKYDVSVFGYDSDELEEDLKNV